MPLKEKDKRNANLGGNGGVTNGTGMEIVTWAMAIDANVSISIHMIILIFSMVADLSPRKLIRIIR